MKTSITHLAILVVSLLSAAEAFAPVSRSFRSTVAPKLPTAHQELQPALQRQRKSVAQVQTMGLFGLGAPEIGVILVAAAFLLGPQKLAELGKDAGRIAGELKEVPKEFQEGLKEGEESAKTMKAEIEAPKTAEVEKKE